MFSKKSVSPLNFKGFGVTKSFHTIDRRVSPLFTVKNAELTAGSIERWNLNDLPAWAKYVPYNYANVVNNSDVELTLTVNDDVDIVIAPNTSVGLNHVIFPAIRTLQIKNEGSSTVAIDKISIRFQKQKTFDEAMDKLVGGI